jgi:aquaporin Z
MVEGWALQQLWLLWLLWLAPLLGAALAGFTYKALLEAESAEAPPVTGRVEIAGP